MTTVWSRIMCNHIKLMNKAKNVVVMSCKCQEWIRCQCLGPQKSKGARFFTRVLWPYGTIIMPCQKCLVWSKMGWQPKVLGLNPKMLWIKAPANMCFSWYLSQINVLQAKKKFEILDSVSGLKHRIKAAFSSSVVYVFTVSSPPQMLSFMQAQYSLFQQGFNLLDEIDPYMKKLAAEVR